MTGGGVVFEETVAELNRLLPELWQAVDELLELNTGKWPAAVLVPTPLCLNLLEQNGWLRAPAAADPDERWLAASRVAEMAAWRLSRCIFRVADEDVPILLRGSVDPDMPIDLQVFSLLPAYCTHVPVPKWGESGSISASFDFIRDENQETVKLALRLRLMFDGVQPAITIIDGTSLRETAEKYAPPLTDLHRDRVAGALCLLHWLCLLVEERGFPQQRVEPKRTKRGLRWFPPDKVREWEVSWRRGAPLGGSEDDGTSRDMSGHLSHGSRCAPRAHIVTASIRNQWYGPRTEGRPGTHQKPLYIRPHVRGGRGAEDLIPTIRQVR